MDDPVPSPEDVRGSLEERKDKRKMSRKKRLPTSKRDSNDDGDDAKRMKKTNKRKEKEKEKEKELDGRTPKKPRKQGRVKLPPVEGLSAAQVAVNEQMRRALEEDQYSANGSIVDTDDDDEDDLQYTYKDQPVRLDRSYLVQAARKHPWFDRLSSGSGGSMINENVSADDIDEVASRNSRGNNRKKKKGKKEIDDRAVSPKPEIEKTVTTTTATDLDFDRDEGSIFGQTTGSSNSTWVECDKCKKWRRLRGVVDERKLPPKWYCSMNKNDPERARCSAPEEEYDAIVTPESAADSRVRKHLRVWVRRLQCNEQYEARQPTQTRGKKRANAATSKDPYEWIRCCNPSCGKWRVILKTMDAKTDVMDKASDGEWYCVMNAWDEKTASCAAPQENLPAIGCPPWVVTD